MTDDTARSYAAAFRQRRREAGWAKLSFWLPPDEVAALNQLKSVYGTQEAAVRAALARLLAE